MDENIKKCIQCKRKIKKKEFLELLKETKSDSYAEMEQAIEEQKKQYKKDSGNDFAFCSEKCFNIYAETTENHKNTNDEGFIACMAGMGAVVQLITFVKKIKK